jgi:CheY-like chemotaxis protein
VARLLLVEDNEPNSDMLTRRLTRRGYAVILAVTGEDALARAAAEMPDLVLMDMSLPAMDGWEATRRLKADPATAAIPVIGLSARAMASDREKALEAGCNDYDTKPIVLDRLLSKMRGLLNK